MGWNRYFRRGYWDQERAREVQAHLDIETDENIARGMPPKEARYAALRKLGSPTLIQEEIYHMNSIGFLETLCQDLRYGIRMMLKNSGFTAVVILTLALGIGVNATMFTLVNAILLKDLPVKDPDQLAAIRAYRRDSGQDFSYPIFRDLSSRQQAFSEMAASGGLGLNHVKLEGELQEIEGANAAMVSANYFPMLGVNAAVGRVFTPEDSRAPGEGAVAVIGYGFWDSRLGRDPSIVGRTINLNGVPFIIIGVAPRGFFGDRVGVARDVWIPILMQPRVSSRDMLERRTATWFRTIGRLKPGISDTQANSELTVLFQQLKAAEITSGTGSLISRDKPTDFRVEVERGSRGLNSLRRQLQQPLQLLMGVVGLVLLIACCNVANLLLARGTARQREIGIRLALGCSRGRLVGQLLTESMLMSLAGGVLGLLVAYWSADLLVTQFSIGVLDLSPDLRILAFTLALSLLTAILFGLVPALQATSVDLNPSLQASSRDQSGSRPRQRISRALVVSQVALSLWLLVGAGLLVRSLQNLRYLDIGVDRKQVMTLSVQADSSAVTTTQLPEVRRQLIARLQSIPGVSSVGFSGYGLFSGSATTAPVRVPGSKVNPEQDGEVRQNWVSAEYFQTVGMKLLLGQVFADRDDEASPKVAVINETMARHYFGPENPIGKMLYFPKVDAQGRYIPFGTNLDKEQGVQIVGVIRDAKYDNLRQATPRMTYLPMSQESGLGSIVVRTAKHPNTIAPQMRQVVKEVNQNFVLRSIRTLEEQIDGTLAQERLVTKLLGFFAVLALLLAAVGLYGVMAYAVARRTREIGIRMALGATQTEVVSMVLRQSLLLVMIGVALGIPAALATTHLLKSLLFGLKPTDPATLGAMAAVMIGVAGLAGFLPARRAASVDPMVALRYE